MNDINKETGIPFPSLHFNDFQKIMLGKKDSISDSLKRVITSYGLFYIALIGGLSLIGVSHDLKLDDLYLGQSIILSSSIFLGAGHAQTAIMLHRFINHFL